MKTKNEKMKNNKLFLLIIISLVIGIALGGLVHYQFPEAIDTFSKNIKLLGTIFIRLVQMIIAPLVFSTLVVGIAKMGDMKMVGRVGGKAMAWFISASLISLLLGMVLVNFFEPGKGTTIKLDDASSASELLENSKGFSLEEFVKEPYYHCVDYLVNNGVDQDDINILAGQTATSLFVRFFESIQHPFFYYIPDRKKDGYGATKKLFQKLILKKPTLIIMVDCGSTSIEALDFLNKNKIKYVSISGSFDERFELAKKTIENLYLT